MGFSSLESRFHSLPTEHFWQLTSSFDEKQWVIQIRQSLEDEELEEKDNGVEDNEVKVCIFNVPKPLMAIDPNSYTPNEVSIGPYHHWRVELYEMGRHKIAAAKRAQNRLQSRNFRDLVDKMTKYEQKTRACYHKFLNLNSETWAWMLAMDASFLLEFLQTCTITKEYSLSRTSSKLSCSVDYDGRKPTDNAILRDIVMLENQIPLFILRNMLAYQYTFVEPSQVLASMLLELYNYLSPFKGKKEVKDVQALVPECFHLLDFLYRMITPILANNPSEIMEDDHNHKEPTKQHVERNFKHSFYPVRELGKQIWKILSKLNSGPAHLYRIIVGSRPLQVIFKLPWTIISKLPGIGILLKPLEHLCSLITGKEEDDDDSPEEGSSRTHGKDKLPLLEEISIPSVSELTKSGVRFSRSDGISAVAFDTKAVKFHLPTITLDVNSEVVLRNLVAYEASKPSGGLVFTRFVDLMNGIIDTEEDVELLTAAGIIRNHLKSNAEVTKLWNGMSKSIKSTKVPFLDKAIEDVNRYYSSRWKVKAMKLVKKYVFASWPLLTLLATILLLALTALQAFCSVYSCSRFSRYLNTAEA
ncbi:putative UPF0481 protein At3g02645 [Cucurbita pepo subsp. pepo]|uniref:putative UPF0481 protein At3g02645 n=1 Tax=Cucurbita pepo subsp. pepo TaxID=3664 RepID=UPI000C9D86EA|nr:putative UPF0481 protein At3g02645 [Cucurbita pepo subsp. pepo]